MKKIFIAIAFCLLLQSTFGQNSSNAFVRIALSEKIFQCVKDDEIKITLESVASSNYQLISKQVRIDKLQNYLVLLGDVTDTGTYNLTVKTVKDNFVIYEGKKVVEQKFIDGEKPIFSLNLGETAPLCNDLEAHRKKKASEKKDESKAYFEVEIETVAWAKKCYKGKKIRIEYDLDDLTELEFGTSVLQEITQQKFKIYLTDMHKIKGQYKFKILDEQDKVVMAELKFPVGDAHFAGIKPIMTYRLGEANLCK